MRCYVLMGVSGCGKSSVGKAVAKSCGMTFIDGDDLHPKTNIEKMASGQPLNDADRAPWLQRVGEALAAADGPAVIGCSALKRAYRNIIRSAVPESVGFMHLDAPKSVLAKRVAAREHHFMPKALLDSQFEALEPLQADETGTVIDISGDFESVVVQAENYVKETLK